MNSPTTAAAVTKDDTSSHLADMNHPTTAAMDTGEDTLSYLADTDHSTTATMDTGENTSPHLPTTDDPPGAAMDVTDDASPSGSNLCSMDLPTSSPAGVGDTQSLNTLASPLPGAGTTDHSPIGSDDRGASEISLRMPSPPLDNPSSTPPSTLSPTTHLPPNTSVPPCPAMSASATPLTQPLLASAGNGTFDLTGVCGDPISESTRGYWESVPGGEKWVAMVKSYLELQKMPPSSRVSAVLSVFFSTRLTTLHLATSAPSYNISTTRVANLGEIREASPRSSACHHRRPQLWDTMGEMVDGSSTTGARCTKMAIPEEYYQGCCPAQVSCQR